MHSQPCVINTDKARFYCAAIIAAKEEAIPTVAGRIWTHRNVHTLVGNDCRRSLLNYLNNSQFEYDFRQSGHGILPARGTAPWVSDGRKLTEIAAENYYLPGLFKDPLRGYSL